MISFRLADEGTEISLVQKCKADGISINFKTQVPSDW